MARLELAYAVSPLHVNQNFGSDPEYYARFKDNYGNPEKGHSGQDFMAYHGQPVYAPIDGVASYVSDSHGGEGVIITTDQTYDYEGGTCFFNIVLWHLCGDTDPKFPAPIPMGGVKTPVKRGDLVGFADNTGAPYESSGDHLHFALVPVTAAERIILPKNGYNGAINPAPYFNGKFALEYKLNALQKAVIPLLQKLLDNLRGVHNPLP